MNKKGKNKLGGDLFKMSKVYVLNEGETLSASNDKIIGVVSRKDVAEKFQDNNTNEFLSCEVYEFELDDPELLDRIAKEGNKT